MKYEEAKEVEAGLTLRLNLRQKLLRIMEHVGNVPKEGKNTQGAGYTYQKIADMLPKVQAACILQGVIFLAYHESTEHHPSHESRNGAQIFVTSVKMTYSFLDTESDEQISVRASGYAFDTSDKAENKAKTAALKYFLKQTFLIGEEDDDSEKDTIEANGMKRELFKRITETGVFSKLMKAGVKEAEGGKEVEERVEGGAEAPKPHEGLLAENVITGPNINDMLAALTSAAGIWGSAYVAGCLKTWAARPVPNIERLGQDGAVDVALIDSLTENDHQVSKFHSRLKKLQAAVEKASGGPNPEAPNQ